MDRRRLESIEKRIRAKTGRNQYPSPGFFDDAPDVEERINEWREALLKEGYSLEAVNLTPAYIENIKE
jgi:hypothetical protein